MEHDPDHAIAHGYVADALAHTGRRGEAKAALQEALRLDPRYQWAVTKAIELHLANGELAVAETIANTFADHAPGAAAECARLTVSAARGDAPRTRAILASLGRDPATPANLLQTAVDTARQRDLGYVVNDLAAELALAPQVHRHMGYFWVDGAVLAKDWKRAVQRLQRLTPWSERLVPAAEHLLGALAEARRARTLRQLDAEPLRSALRAHAVTWAVVGWALQRCGQHRHAVAWLADWAERGDCAPWMLFNLSYALRQLGQLRQARLVSEHALRLPADHDTPSHALFLAGDAMAAGDVAQARELLTRGQTTSDEGYFGNVRALVAAWLTRRDDGFVAGAQAFAKVAQGLLRPGIDRTSRQLLRTAVRQIARGGGVRAAVWRLAWTLRL
jgi:tetratricopeptide (TPR) repeat protein